MLHSTRALGQLSMHGIDGGVGRVRDLYFDDEHWVVRYLVVEAGAWLTGREVLISPMAVAGIAWDEARVNLNLTCRKIEDSPYVETHPELSRRGEAALLRHYGYPYYWGGPSGWGDAILPLPEEQPVFDDSQGAEIRTEMEEAGAHEYHLRSCNEVAGYKIAARDDRFGHVVDFLFDESDWSIQYLVIDPRDFWPGKHVTVGIEHVREVYRDDKEVATDLSSRDIEAAPAYDPDQPPPARAMPRRGRGDASLGA